MPIRSWMSLILGQNEPEHPQLFALEFGKIAEYDFVHSLSSTNIDQSAPNLVKMYVIIRSQMRSIMDLIGPELSELNSSICKYRPINTKLGQNISANKVLDEFDYETNQTRTSRVICP